MVREGHLTLDYCYASTLRVLVSSKKVHKHRHVEDSFMEGATYMYGNEQNIDLT